MPIIEHTPGKTHLLVANMDTFIHNNMAAEVGVRYREGVGVVSPSGCGLQLHLVIDVG